MFVRKGRATGSIIHAEPEDDELGGETFSTPEPVVDPEPIEDAIEVTVEDEPDDSGEPNTDWQRSALDEYAAQHGLDTTNLPNKAAVVQAIQDSA